MNRNHVTTRQTQVIADPDAVFQGNRNLCGPAAVLRTVLKHNPKLVVEFVVAF